jgi:ferredoxin
MAHHGLKSGYERLTERINKFPQGAPSSEVLYKILSILFSEREAELVSSLPIKPFTAKKAARAWKMNEAETRSILDGLADKALLLDYQDPSGEQVYLLPPPMAGFFEFSLMRIREDIDQRLLSELFEQYLQQSDDFMLSLFTGGETQFGRVFVNEHALSEENALHVLDYERASEVVKTATHIGVSLCFCRHKMQHLGRDCDAPKDICMTFNSSGDALSRHGFARKIEASECLELLEQARAHRLVQFGENARNNVSFICNCCGCCCEALIAAKRFGLMNPIHTTNFLPDVDAAACTGCGRCASACPLEIIELAPAKEPERSPKRVAKVDERVCLGCGVCVRACSHGALKLKSREKRVITPVDGVHRIVLMAIERGKLQNLIFDNQVAFSHRAMGALLGAILRLPPVKQALAKAQMRSRYLERLTQEGAKGL